MSWRNSRALTRSRTRWPASQTPPSCRWDASSRLKAAPPSRTGPRGDSNEERTEKGMSPIRLANAPVSWGAIMFEGFADDPLGYEIVLDEIAETGYAGTELGDYGFYPTDPAALRAELDKRGLSMRGAYVGNRL